MTPTVASGRGSTRRGRPARLPEEAYQPSTMPAGDLAEDLAVVFRGEDGREAMFRVDTLPLPGWHEPVAAAWARRIGPAGGLRTLNSARTSWRELGRFLRFLDSLARPPATPAQLTSGHVERFIRHLSLTVQHVDLPTRVGTVARVLSCPPLEELVPVAALESLNRRWANRRRQGSASYSSGELTRLVRAARGDVAALRDRIEAGQHRIAVETATDKTNTETASAETEASATALREMGRTGQVPRFGLEATAELPARRDFAGQLFVRFADLTPLLVLLVAVTGRNIETIKELPAEHRIMDDRAVQLRLTKRRRGSGRWTETVAWETGPPHRQLHTPGGLYLLAHRLCATGRRFRDLHSGSNNGSGSIWSIWRAGNRDHPAEHVDPFARDLDIASKSMRRWASEHGLTSDPTTPDGPAGPFRLNFQRLRTSIEVRRTHQLGGHLPSAARANTVPVLYRDYLRSDPTTIDWARRIVGDAVADAERAALEAHRRAVTTAGGTGPLVITEATTHSSASNAEPESGAARSEQQTGWSGCVDPQHHPVSGRRCRASFLDCFHCGNALITSEHLPGLLALLDALSARRQQMPVEEWWARYGSAWAALRHDVLGKFSEPELAHAAANKPADALLDLVEDPWERP